MPTRTVLADTGPLLAMADPSDQYHERANEELVRLEAEQRELLFCFPILLETFSILQRHLSSPFARRWLGAVLEAGSVLNARDEDYRSAHELISRYDDQVVSLFDATLAALSDRLEVPVWTFDSDFDVLKVSVWR